MIGQTELARVIYLAWSDNAKPKSEKALPWDYLDEETKHAWKEVATIVAYKVADSMV